MIIVLQVLTGYTTVTVLRVVWYFSNSWCYILCCSLLVSGGEEEEALEDVIIVNPVATAAGVEAMGEEEVAMEVVVGTIMALQATVTGGTEQAI